jgi:hypothetical protein
MNNKIRSIIKVVSISTLVLAACATALQAAPQEEATPVGTEAQDIPPANPSTKGTPVQEKVESSDVSATVETEPVQSEPPSGEALLDPDEKPPSGTQNEFSTDFSVHTVPYSEILSGGPPKNGIPAVDDPQFTSIEEADEWILKKLHLNRDNTKAPQNTNTTLPITPTTP